MTGDYKPGSCQSSTETLGADCGSRGMKPCGSGFYCTGPTPDDRPGDCIALNGALPSPGEEVAFGGFRGMKACRSGLVCWGAGANDTARTCKRAN